MLQVPDSYIFSLDEKYLLDRMRDTSPTIESFLSKEEYLVDIESEMQTETGLYLRCLQFIWDELSSVGFIEGRPDTWSEIVQYRHYADAMIELRRRFDLFKLTIMLSEISQQAFDEFSNLVTGVDDDFENDLHMVLLRLLGVTNVNPATACLLEIGEDYFNVSQQFIDNLQTVINDAERIRAERTKVEAIETVGDYLQTWHLIFARLHEVYDKITRPTFMNGDLQHVIPVPKYLRICFWIGATDNPDNNLITDYAGGGHIKQAYHPHQIVKKGNDLNETDIVLMLAYFIAYLGKARAAEALSSFIPTTTLSDEKISDIKAFFKLMPECVAPAPNISEERVRCLWNSNI